jgi:hypothetical protein
MPRGKRKVPLTIGQISLLGEPDYPPPTPPEPTCWKCGIALAEFRKRRAPEHTCEPACTRCGAPYWWKQRASPHDRGWQPRCGCRRRDQSAGASRDRDEVPPLQLDLEDWVLEQLHAGNGKATDEMLARTLHVPIDDIVETCRGLEQDGVLVRRWGRPQRRGTS